MTSARRLAPTTKGAPATKVNDLIVNINSEQPERLTTFYRDVVGLEPRNDMGAGAFKVGATTFIIDGHSELRGGTKEPARVLIDLMVDDIASEEARLEAAGVQFIRRQGREYWGGVTSTFLDPDGNYCQIMAMVAEPANA